MAINQCYSLGSDPHSNYGQQKNPYEGNFVHQDKNDCQSQHSFGQTY